MTASIFFLEDYYREILRQQQQGEEHYRSGHDYNLEQFGLTPGKITSRFGTVYERFRFQQEPATDEKPGS